MKSKHFADYDYSVKEEYRVKFRNAAVILVGKIGRMCLVRPVTSFKLNSQIIIEDQLEIRHYKRKLCYLFKLLTNNDFFYETCR